MEVAGNTPNPREPARKGNGLHFGVGGLLLELFGRFFWLLVGAARLSRKPIQACPRPCCRYAYSLLGMSNNMHYVK
jgi:hypothetical protein